MKNSKEILFVTGSDYTQQVYTGLEKLIQEGYSFSVLTDGLVSPRMDIFENHYTADLRRTKHTLEKIEEIVTGRRSGKGFDAVINKSSEWLTPLTALLCKRFNCKGNTPNTAFLCRSKYHMRQQMNNFGIESPKFFLCKSFEDLKNAAKKLNKKCVAKPVGGNASYGTFVIDPKNNLDEYKKQYDDSIIYLNKKAIDEDIFGFAADEFPLFDIDYPVDMITDYIIEEFLEGSEISLDSIVQDGKVFPLGIALQQRMPEPFFVQLGEMMPFTCEAKLMQEIVSLNERCIKAFNITDSAVHLEIMLTPDGPRVVELGCRIGGDNIHDAVLQTSGYHLVYESVLVGLGIKREYNYHPKKVALMKYLLPYKNGTVSKVSFSEEALKKNFATEWSICVKPGDQVAPPPENYDFLGYVQVVGENFDEANSNLDIAINKIEIEVL